MRVFGGIYFVCEGLDEFGCIGLIKERVVDEIR